MATYDCKTPACKGKLIFPAQSQSLLGRKPIDHKKLIDTSLTVIKDEPVECRECGRSYFEREVQ